MKPNLQFSWRTRLKRSRWMVLYGLVIGMMFRGVDGLILDPIQQRTSLRAYDAGSMLLHDEFHIPIYEYSDPLHSNKDWTYFVSRAHPGEYEFKKFSHSTMTATTIKDKIMLDDYTVLDSCQNGDVLDYLVVIYEPTGDIQVLDLKVDGVK